MSGVLDLPFALASDGTLLLGMTHTDGSLEPEALLKRALENGGRVFIGVELDGDEKGYVRTFVHDGFCEAAATVAGARAKSRGGG